MTSDATKSAPAAVAATTLTGEHQHAFAEQGFVLVPGLLSAEEIEHYGAAVDRAVAMRSSWDPRALAERTQYEQSFQQCLNLWEDCEEVRPLTFHPLLAEAAARLLGVEAVRLWHDQALYKAVGGRCTDPHQDQPYWAIEEPLTITAWIPFQAINRVNGAMGYFPGTHRSGLRKFSNIFSGTGLDLERHSETRGRSAEYQELEPGTVAFHHGLTVHRAYPNRSRQTRRVHTVIYFADGCRRSQKVMHPCVDRPGIAPGAKIESALTPLVWPRVWPRDRERTPALPPPAEPPLPGWAGWRPSIGLLRALAANAKGQQDEGGA